MTSAHSAKETENGNEPKMKLHENCQSFVTIENEHTLDPKGDHIMKGQGMKDQLKSSFRSKA